MVDHRPRWGYSRGTRPRDRRDGLDVVREILAEALRCGPGDPLREAYAHEIEALARADEASQEGDDHGA